MKTQSPDYNTAPKLGKPEKREELKRFVGETITGKGIGGESFQVVPRLY